MAVRIFYEETAPLKEIKIKRTKGIIRHILADFSFNCGDINIVFTSDEYLINMNRQYLSHDYYTDIITFPVYDDDTVSGDVFISSDRVRENAEKFRVDFCNELMRVIIHGTLHLCGMKDTTPSLRKRMTAHENKYLDVFGSL